MAFSKNNCGNWMKNSERRTDRSSRKRFSELNESNLGVERGILGKAGTGGAGRNAIDQKIGGLYGSCIDEKAVNEKGIAPLKPELDRVAAVKDKGALIDEIAHVHVVGPSPLFNFYSNSDLHNADNVIANIDQGGLSLPDRDYYIKDDARMVEMRKHYVDYVTEMFTLEGQSAERAAESAKTVLRIETALAKASMDRTERRDPNKRDHKMKREEAGALAPHFSLGRFFVLVGAPGFAGLNLRGP